MTERNARFTPEEDALILARYAKLGPKGLLPLMPHRTLGGIKRRAERIKAERTTAKVDYTDAELTALRRRLRGEINKQAVLALLPGRTWNAVRTKLSAMRAADGLSPGHQGLRNAWTVTEDSIISEKYPAGGYRACAPFLPGRTQTAIVTRATRRKIFVSVSIELDEDDDKPVQRVSAIGSWRADPLTAVNSIFNLAAA